MKVYLVETFTEKFKNCGLLLGGRMVFTQKAKAKKFITAEKRRYSKEQYRIEFWEVATRRLNANRLAELIVTEDIWCYFINRKELIEEYKNVNEA
jgi:hypothetical protein